MTAAIRDSFRAQAEVCTAMGSPFMGSLLHGLARDIDTDTATGRRVLTWPGDPSARGDALALRLAGALHRLVLTGADAGLARVYPGGPDAGDGAALAPAVVAALRRHDATLVAGLSQAPQTNEVRRSAALIAAGHWLAAHVGLPMVLSELGTSAGLNLIWDRYRLAGPDWARGPAHAPLTLTPDWRGPPPPKVQVTVTDRAGADLNPLSPGNDPAGILCWFWPDQTDRIARTRAALAEAARLAPPLARADAVDWLADRSALVLAGRLHVIFHTVTWQYFPQVAQDRGQAILAAAGARATAAAPLAHLSMEADAEQGGAALTLTLWPGGRRIALGRADFHGRWIDWQAPPP